MPESYFLFSNGDLKRKDNVVRITAKDGTFKDIKIEMARDIYLFGEISTNTKCLNYLSEMKIPVHMFNYYGNYTGSFYPREANVSGNLLIKQVEFYSNMEERTTIAQSIIEGASFNMLRNLRYYQQRGKDLEGQRNNIKSLRKEISSTNSVQELLGIEGNIRKSYYASFNTIVNQEIDFQKRVKRPPDNMINTLISFTNSLVYSTCLSEIYVTQLNPTISYLHSAGERRFSLCLDIAEIFKPLIADRIIFSLLNKNIITEKDFEEESNYYYMKKTAQQKILAMYNERLDETIRHRELNRNISYRRLIRLEGYKLIKHLLGEKKYEGFKIWW